jgi:hypothetical protein
LRQPPLARIYPWLRGTGGLPGRWRSQCKTHKKTRTQPARYIHAAESARRLPRYLVFVLRV